MRALVGGATEANIVPTKLVGMNKTDLMIMHRIIRCSVVIFLFDRYGALI
jgi:hypothetical protein